MYYVYALLSNDNARIYVGLTKNLKSRIDEHNLGRTKTTKHCRPWHLLYCEEVSDRVRARVREKQLKSGCGKEFLKNIRSKHEKRARSSAG